LKKERWSKNPHELFKNERQKPLGV
jgi:hypothetical protein